MPFRGDLEALGRMAKELDAKAKAIPSIAESGAAALRPIVAAQLSAGRTPYGESWKPKADGGRALVGAAATVTARGAAIVASVGGELSYHNTGTVHVPRRQLIPDEGQGLPPTWKTVLDVATARALGEGR